MKQVIELMLLVLSALIFSFSLSGLFKGTENIKQLQAALKNMDSGVYSEDFKIIDELTFKRSDIIASLMAEKLEHDIEVSGILFSSAGHDSLLIRNDFIKDVDYRREYIYSQSGKVLKVIYTECQKQEDLHE